MNDEMNDALIALGQQVLERRESIGMTLETVYDRTKIRPEYLRGIESGEYKNFPEVVYIKGFVRTYLKLIGAEDLQEDFMNELDKLDKTKSPRKQENKPNNNISKILNNGSSIPKGFKPASHFWLFLVLIAALVGTAAYVWYAITYGGFDPKTFEFFKFGNSNNNNPPAIISSGDLGVIVDGEIESVTLSEDETVSEEPEPEPEPYIEVHAINDVWMSVAFGNAQPIFRRTLKRGESMRWDLTNYARINFGRPNAAQVILNGKDLGIVNPSAKRAETYIYNPDGTFRRSGSR